MAIMLSLAGCAALSTAPPEEQVKHRAQQRWDALKSRDFRAAYTFLSPPQKAATPEADYIRLMADGSNWVEAKVVNVTCSQQLCNPTIRLDVASPIPRKFGGNIVTHIDEDWVFIEGEWWFKQK